MTDTTLNIQSLAELNAAIETLERNRTDQVRLVKEQYLQACESIKPVNLIKRFFRKAADTLKSENNFLTIAANMASAFISKKLIESEKQSKLKKLLGTVLIFGISNAVAQHPENIRTMGNKLMNLIKKKRSNGVIQVPD